MFFVRSSEEQANCSATMSALVSARDWRVRSMAICVSSLENRTCSTATWVFKRTCGMAIIQRKCDQALFVSSLATNYPQFISYQRRRFGDVAHEATRLV